MAVHVTPHKNGWQVKTGAVIIGFFVRAGILGAAHNQVEGVDDQRGVVRAAR